MKKYNTAIHISFWVLVVFLISMVTFSIFSDNYKIGSLLPFLKSAGLPEKVVVTETKEVEKKVDWYYFVASGYSANDPAQGTNNVTATGKEAGVGVIAVDPDVIPLGTRIEIKDMGFFTAEDTGGKIKGNRIDICFDSKKEAREFGKKGVWVQIIDSSYKLDLADL
jgi:3D (Asp-Asp-Asp) domain-containing protein